MEIYRNYLSLILVWQNLYGSKFTAGAAVHFQTIQNKVWKSLIKYNSWQFSRYRVYIEFSGGRCIFVFMFHKYYNFKILFMEKYSSTPFLLYLHCFILWVFMLFKYLYRKMRFVIYINKSATLGQHFIFIMVLIKLFHWSP